MESDGAVYILTETTPGNYTTSALTGTPGKTYNMTAIVAGNTYTASSTMPQPVGMDSIYVSNGPLSNKLYVTVVYNDPIGVPQ